MKPAASLPDAYEVIIVDDDAAVLSALKFSLEVEGFPVATYRSGAGLLAQENLPPSGCLVLDFRLPESDGLELLAKLRRRRVSLPAILITSHPSPALRSRAAFANVPIVEKPLLGNALSETIRSLRNAA
jgi:FixJ family two-component response regulator